MRRPDPRLFMLLLAALAGCGGAANASRQRTRYAVSQGALPQASEIRVAEYLADYPESFPDPGPHAGAGLTLEGARAAWGGNEEAPLVVVQAGVRGRSAEIRQPVALMFVVDRSGSMNEADKMTFVRRGLHTLVGSLDPSDAVGIVAFDNTAEVLSPLTEVGRGGHLSAAIDRLEPRGGTNLSGGLDAGYAELDRHDLSGFVPRVVLLTDAMANVGETDLHRIAGYAERADQAGIGLSAIGVGLQYDDQVLVEMTRRGHGNHYFLDSPDEIDRVFRRELNGMLEDVADRVQLAYRPRPGVEVVRVEGADATRGPEGWNVDLGRLGAGEHRVVLFTLRGVDPLSQTPEVGGFELSFEDVRSGEPFVQTDARPVFFVQDAAQGSVARNSAVAWMARDLQHVSRLAQGGRLAEAEARLARVRAVIDAVRQARPDDTELDRDAAMLTQLAHTLAARSGHPVRSLTARVALRAE